MTDAFAKVMDVAKKLRKAVKKVDQDVAELIIDLNLHLADHKVEMAEQTQRQSTPAPQNDSVNETSAEATQKTSADSKLDSTPAPWPHGEDLSSVANTTGTWTRP